MASRRRSLSILALVDFAAWPLAVRTMDLYDCDSVKTVRKWEQVLSKHHSVRALLRIVKASTY